MTKREQLLYRIMQVPGTINNHYSREAKTAKGCLLQPSKYFKSFEKQGLIRKAVYDLEPSNKRRDITYYITHKGAKLIGEESNYKFKDFKASIYIMHDSMVRDIALSFIYLYPNIDFKFEYEPIIKGRKPDLFITAKLENGSVYTFWVEVERKKECYRDVLKKAEIFNEVKNKLPNNTKCLFVLCSSEHNSFLRPQEYELDEKTKNSIVANNKQFNRIIKARFKLSNYFLFLNFIDFYRLNEPIWFTADGNSRQLIQ